jgi:hypothetical protein
MIDIKVEEKMSFINQMQNKREIEGRDSKFCK